jgi:thiol-disulfide isomerase/thioredoxin
MAIQTCPKCGTKNRVDEWVARLHKPVCGKCGASLDAAAYGKPQTVTDATFAQEVVAASSALLSRSGRRAEWCGPCRMIAPVLDQFPAESGGRYKIAKLNVDENPHFAAVRHPQHSHDADLQEWQLVDQIVGPA